jgi:methyl-accepting chemotaxis protein
MQGENIQHRLNGIVEELGEVYLSMSENYPVLFDQLEKEFGGLSVCDEDQNSRVIEDASKGVTQLLDNRDRMLKVNHAREEELIKTVDAELEKLAGMEREIDGIEECSEDLELISLNAMVSALKAGNRGGAFPYITRELQRVSRLSAESSASIRFQGGVLDREYKKFIENIRQNQKDTGQDINLVFSSLNEVVDRLKERGDDFSRQCLMLQNATRELKKPVHMIIEEVQKHDIVRQSINHIIISLDEIEAHNEEQEIGKRLDSLKFSSQVYELSRFIIEDIKESVNNSFMRFTGEKQEVENIIDQLGRSIAGDSGHSRNGKESANKVEIMEEELKSRMQSFNKSGLKDNRAMHRVSEMIDDLEEGIDRFKKILNTIRNIHVSSRIEVVKLSSLENMDNIIVSIDGTVSQMESRLEDISSTVENFRKASTDIIDEFSEYFIEVNERLGEGFHDVKGILNAINQYQESLTEQGEKISNISQEFRQFSQMVEVHLLKMKALIEEIDMINTIFKEKKVMTDSLLDDLLKQSGKESWELKGDGIKKLIDKFTIFIHKKKLTEGDEIISMNIDDEQAQASEITLF